MDTNRRLTLRAAGGAGFQAALGSAGLLRAGAADAQAFNAAAFQARSVSDALKALGAGAPADSREVAITAPEIAENGAVVQVAVRSALPRTDFIALLVDRNPNALAGAFELPDGTDPDVTLRIKMSQTSQVVALVRADGRYYWARREIKVTIGGCG